MTAPFLCFISVLISLMGQKKKKNQARVNSSHDVLEIGCGWGSFAVQLVKQTGCRYTGITLSEEQLKLAKKRAKEAGLEVRTAFTS